MRLLQAGIKVSNDNIAPASLSTSILSAGTLPAGVQVTNDNVAAGALTMDRLTCPAGASLTPLTCAKV